MLSKVNYIVTLEFKDTATPISKEPVTILWDNSRNSLTEIASLLFATVYKNFDSKEHNLRLQKL